MLPRWPLLLLVLSSCDPGKPQDPAAAVAETPAAAPRPEPAESRFPIGTREYPELKDPPAEPVAFRFDFSGKRVYAFDFHQSVVNTSDMGGFAKAPGPIEQTLEADGSLLMKSKGGGAGTLVLKDMKATMSMSGGLGGADRSMEVPMPAMAVPDVREDGGMEGGASSVQPLLKLLFPMPPKPLAKGESVDIPLSMPFNMMGSPLSVKGRARVTLTGFAVIEEAACARLDVVIDISKLDVPEEVESKASCSVKGRSVYYWDLERKEFVSGKTAVLMKVRSEGPAPKLPAGAPPMPETLKMSMVSDNLLRITRNVERSAREEAGK